MCFNCNPFVVECQDNDLDLFNPYQLKICLSDHTIHVFENCSKKSSDPYIIYIYIYTYTSCFVFSTAEGQKHYSHRSAYICSWHIFQLDSNQPRHFATWVNEKNYFTSSDPHHDMLGGGCQVRVVIKNMMGRMENLRTLISGFLGLVILVRWALVTMFLS